MIERKFISRNLKTYLVNEYLENTLKRVGYSGAKVQRTPLGEKVIITASKPGLIVGKKGSNIKKLTVALKNKFGLENPQIEINEVENINLDAKIVAERIVNYLERFGSSRFKSIGHRVIKDVIDAGAIGIEVIVSGKVPGARAKSWRFYQGYLKKCGDMAVSGIKKCNASAKLKSGTVGIKVRIMPAELREKYEIKLIKKKTEVVEEVKEDKSSEKNKKEGKEENTKTSKKENPKKKEIKSSKKKTKETNSKEEENKDSKEDKK